MNPLIDLVSFECSQELLGFEGLRTTGLHYNSQTGEEMFGMMMMIMVVIACACGPQGGGIC